VPERIAVVTPLFPIRAEPFRGQPIYFTVRELARLTDVKVFCPLARYPESPWLRPRSYVYYPPDPTYVPEGVESAYFEYSALPVVSRPWNGWLCERRLRPLLSAWKPDLILSYWLYPEGWSAVLAGRKLKVPVIVGSRGSDLGTGLDLVTRFQTKRVVQCSAGVLTVSEQLRNRAISLGAEPNRVRTVMNGCDLSTFHRRERQIERTRHSIPADAELIVFVGHLVGGKGVRELVDAVAELAPKRPRLRAVLIGDGRLESELRMQASRLGIEERIHLAGRASAANIASWLGACDVFTLPSYSEGFPNVVVEALACGRPVVATHVGGIPDLVSKETGILIAPRETKALASALEAALSANWDADDIARRWSRGWQDVARDTLDFCSAIAASARRKRPV
jgi:glycosyltransferase involved in cell wall biosynthesis